MTYDVAIVGSGPAGMSAAVRLRSLGATVAVIDEQPEPGGQIWRGIERNLGSRMFAALGADYEKGRALAAQFRACGADYLAGAQVWQIEEGWVLFASVRGETSQISARAVLLANGAQERPVPFPGWTLPGVMTVGAAQVLLKSGGMLPQGRIWIAGAGPLPLLYATQLLNLGGQIAGYLDTAKRPSLAAVTLLPRAWRDFPSLLKGLGWLRALRRTGVVKSGASDLRAGGNDRLEFITWESSGRLHSAPADVLLVHEGVVPRIHETLAMGCAHHWNEEQGYFAPTLNEWGETSRANLFVAGDAGGIGGWVAATVSGESAALGIVKRLNLCLNTERLRAEWDLVGRRRRAIALRPFLDRFYRPPRQLIPDETIVCRCEEVTAGNIRAVALACAPDPAAIKAATRCGMGPCQGRQCGYSVQALIAEAHGVSAGEVRFFNIRPPLKPVTLGELAKLAAGQ
ncbi:NAD(P)/FAD-dependent oxidoreductase (plasmid) [Agrobacterium vitis]|uniref:FAD-dependent oxidoreductase n=1 Tax=Agrobacterium vitis TaxID=373 RepID=UPI0012E8495A|nr:NAD(P)/FAD-dependent oxidoreductase [Agrobacterium vitis]MVA27091.1 FAD-binding protein [Agrobacterium vitis]